MGRTINYNKLKELYTEDELINFLYNHYYYVIDKIYIRNNEIIPINVIEECYKNGIAEFVSRNNTNENPSKYIHSKLVSLERSCKSKNSKKEYYELLKRAYLDDIDARKTMFFSQCDKIDNKIIKVGLLHLLNSKYITTAKIIARINILCLFSAFFQFRSFASSPFQIRCKSIP